MFGDIIQPTHLLFILVVALVVLGPKRLPEVGRSLGKGIRDFRGAMSGIEEHANGMFQEEPTPPSAPVRTPEETVSAIPIVAKAVSEPEPSEYAD